MTFRMAPGQLASGQAAVTIPVGASPTRPYYTALDRDGAFYGWPGSVRGDPFEAPAFQASFSLARGGRVTRELVYRFVHQAIGEVRRPLMIVPRVGVSLDESSGLWPQDQAARSLTVTLRHGARDTTAGRLELIVPAGWAAPAPQPFTLTREGEEQRFRFALRLPAEVELEHVAAETAEEARLVVEGDEGALRPDLRLGGTGEAPELLGRVYLDATTLFLPAGGMQFDSGVIHFEAVDPGRPRLDMVGAARMVGYDITAVVEGPYDEPSVTLSSAPPLPDAELLALVLTGQPPKTPGSDSAEKRQGLNVAVFIGRDVLMRLPGGGTTESLQAVLECFDVDVGRSVTRAGDETINARFRVPDGVLRPGDTLYLTGEKDVFDHYNAGVRLVFRFR